MKNHVHFKKNTIGKDYFVGDIHGCFGLLVEAMLSVNFNENTDRLFSVGDLVDRGPQSELALQFLNEPYFFPIQGNHEDMAIRYPNGNMSSEHYIMNGGAWMVALDKETQRTFSDAFKQLPYVITVETEVGLVTLVHAESGPNVNYLLELLNSEVKQEQEFARRLVMWDRSRLAGEYKSGDVVGTDYVIVGHTPVKQITRVDNIIYIDTGAVFGKARGYGTLTLDTIENLVTKAVTLNVH